MIKSNESYEIISCLSDKHKDQLHKMFKNEWWSKNRTRSDVDAVLSGSSFVVGIVHKDTDELIGFARVLTDYFKYAYVYDVIVSSHQRGNRLGHKIIDAVINHTHLQKVKNIELTCSESMTKFYEKYGFSTNYKDTVPMRRSDETSKRN